MKIEFFKIAKNPYSEHIRKIEDISRDNVFKDWFPESERDYFYLETDNMDSDDLRVIKFLKSEGYEVTDYKKGLARRFDSKREIKIGKLLNNIEKNALKSLQKMKLSGEVFSIKRSKEDIKKRISDIREKFEQSYFRNSGKNFVVVISNNRHDIAKMSTDRNWTSCMSLDDGCHSADVYCEVENGGFIAYLTYAGDNYIEKPISRIRIRRFLDLYGSRENIAVPEESVYGLDLPSFRKAVSRWIQEKQPHAPIGIYSLKGGGYSDTFDENYFYFPEDLSTEELIDLFLMKDGGERFIRDYYEVVAKNDPLELCLDVIINSENSETIEDFVFSIDGLKFKTEREAKIVSDVHNGYYYDYLEHCVTYLSEEEYEEYQEYLKSDESVIFYPEKKVSDLRPLVRHEAALMLSSEPKGAVPLDIIKMLVSEDWEVNKKVVLMNIKARYPELISIEDVERFKLGLENISQIKDASILKDSIIEKISWYSNNIDSIFPKYNSDDKLFAYGYFKDKTIQDHHLVSLRSLMDELNIVRNLFSPIPEPTIRDLIIIAMNLPIDIELDYDSLSYDKVMEDIRFYSDEVNLIFPEFLMGIFTETKSDTPSVQHFLLEKLLPYYDSKIDSSSSFWMLKSIYELGINGRIFIRWVQDQISEMESRYRNIDELSSDYPYEGTPPLSYIWDQELYETLKAVEYKLLNPNKKKSPYKFVLKEKSPKIFNYEGYS